MQVEADVTFAAGSASFCVTMQIEVEVSRPLAKPNAGDRRIRVEALFREHGPELGRYLVAMVRDRTLAEDLLQDTFLDALHAGNQLADVRNARAWLYGIARNRALGSFRRSRRLRSAITRLGGRIPAQDNDEEVVALQDLLERELTPELRALVLLRYLHGFEAVELAAMTGLSADAVRQRLARARRRLLAAAQPLVREAKDNDSA